MKPLKRFLYGVLVYSLVIGVIGCGRQQGKSPVELFESDVLNPIPPSIKKLKAHYSGGNDWSAYLYFESAASDIDRIIALHRLLRMAPTDSSHGLTPSQVLRLFQFNGWPSPNSLPSPQIYFLDDSQRNRTTYLITDTDHTTAFISIMTY